MELSTWTPEKCSHALDLNIAYTVKALQILSPRRIHHFNDLQRAPFINKIKDVRLPPNLILESFYAEKVIIQIGPNSVFKLAHYPGPGTFYMLRSAQAPSRPQYSNAVCQVPAEID